MGVCALAANAERVQVHALVSRLVADDANGHDELCPEHRADGKGETKGERGVHRRARLRLDAQAQADIALSDAFVRPGVFHVH